MDSYIQYDQTSLTGQYLLGYHGCDESVATDILAGKIPHLQKSRNAYDWLGPGVYFWVDSPARALNWATDYKGRGASKIQTPCVLGAILQPGRCLNLTDFGASPSLKNAYEVLKNAIKRAGEQMPQNTIEEDGVYLRRKLDCAVIQCLHSIRHVNKDPSYDSVLGVFEEGAAIFEGSGIKEKTHIQIAVRNVEECIKGYFRVPGL